MSFKEAPLFEIIEEGGEYAPYGSTCYPVCLSRDRSLTAHISGVMCLVLFRPDCDLADIDSTTFHDTFSQSLDGLRPLNREAWLLLETLR